MFPRESFQNTSSGKNSPTVPSPYKPNTRSSLSSPNISTGSSTVPEEENVITAGDDSCVIEFHTDCSETYRGRVSFLTLLILLKFFKIDGEAKDRVASPLDGG